MREQLFLPIMIIPYSDDGYFASFLTKKIREFKTPDGVEIIDVKRGTDDVLTYIFEKVMNQNKGSCEDDLVVENEMDNFLYIEVESDTPIRYQKLTWLEDQIKDVVRNYDESVGIYFFYLLNESEFSYSNILKVISKDGIKIFEDEFDDDFSFLIQHVLFLNHYWYLHDGNSLYEAYPALSAKLFLLFG